MLWLVTPGTEDTSYATYQAWRPKEYNMYSCAEISSNPHGQSEMLLSDLDKAGCLTFEQQTQAVAARLYIYFQACYH